jgi:hypothetical protein
MYVYMYLHTVPEFLLSSDFLAYFETTAASLKGHLQLNSPDWYPKFVSVFQNYRYPLQLFPLTQNDTMRPYANSLMRDTFGEVCDAPSPSPIDYLDPSTDPREIEEVLDALQDGEDCMCTVKCKSSKGLSLDALLFVKVPYPLNPYLSFKYCYIINVVS